MTALRPAAQNEGPYVTSLSETKKAFTYGDMTLDVKTIYYVFNANENAEPAFYKQPKSGEVLLGEQHTVTWGTNFTPLKVAVVTYRTGFRILSNVLDDPTTRSYSFSVMSNGFYQIRAYYSDTEYISSDKIYVTEKKNLTYSVDGTVSGVETGVDVTLELWAKDGTAPAFTAALTGNGKYSWTEVPEGDYTLKVSASGYLDYSADISVTQDVSYSLTMEGLPAASITGTVRSTGAGDAAVLVSLYKNGERVNTTGNYGNSIRYSFDECSAGAYTVRAERAGCITKEVQVELSGSDVTVNINLNAVPDDYILGDADGNGTVNVADILIIRKYIAGMVDETCLDLRAADVTGDEFIATSDVLKIRKYMAGLIDEL